MSSDSLPIGNDFKRRDRFSPRYFRRYGLIFDDVPFWAIKPFFEMLKSQAKGMSIEVSQITLTVDLTTCSLDPHADPDVEDFKNALALLFLQPEATLLEEHKTSSLAESEVSR